jgi:phage tail P2-like protein
VTNLTTFKFNDLLPLSVKDDPKFVAASTCLDKLFNGFDERVKLMFIYSRIDELDSQQLDDLAWQWNIGYYEGYSFAETLEDKRALVKNAIMLHWHKGTLWAMKSVPRFLGMPAFSVEWFEADLLGTEMEPYEFDFAIDTGVRGASPTIQQDIRNLINNLKNTRSYLRHIILMSSWRVTAYFGAQSQGVNLGTIRPLWWPGGTAEIKYSQGAVSYGAAAGHVRPLIWLKKVMPIDYAWVIGSQAMVAGRVIPKPWSGGDIALRYGRAVGGYGASVGYVKPKYWLGGDVVLEYGRAVGQYSSSSVSVRPMFWPGASIHQRYGRATGSYGAQTGRVTPKKWQGGSVKVNYNRALGNYSASRTRVYPKIALVNIAAKIIKNNRMGMYAATVGRVYPKYQYSI